MLPGRGVEAVAVNGATPGLRPDQNHEARVGPSREARVGPSPVARVVPSQFNRMLRIDPGRGERNEVYPSTSIDINNLFFLVPGLAAEHRRHTQSPNQGLVHGPGPSPEVVLVREVPCRLKRRRNAKSLPLTKEAVAPRRIHRRSGNPLP